MHAHVLIFLCVWLIAKLVCVGSPSHSPPNTPTDGFITNLITSKVTNIPSLGLCQCVKTSRMFSLLSFGNSGKHHMATTSLLVLILCGDIELNPGPKQNSVYPCGFCEQKVDFGMKAICCDTCDIWFHKTCVSMTSSVYSELNSTENWFCYRCHSTNCDTFHSYEFAVPTSNSFSVLANSEAEEVFISPLPQHPKAHSSPLGTTTTPAAHIPSYTTSTSSTSGNNTSANCYLPNKGENWRTLVININSIFGKAAAFQDMLQYVKPDAVIITETKLRPDISTAEVIPSDLGYTVYRRDRSDERFSGGGGVMLLIKSCYASTEVTPEDTDRTCELIWVEVEMRDQKKLLVSSFYRRPGDRSVDHLESLHSSLSRVQSRYRSPNQPIIMGGDYNLPDICWDKICVKGDSSQKSLHEYFLSFMHEFSLSQFVLEPTRDLNILDLVLTNIPSLVKSVHIIPGLSDHEAVVADCCIIPRHIKKPPRKVHLFSKADWDKLRQEAREFSSDFLHNCVNFSVNEKWCRFKDNVKLMVDKFVPHKITSTRYNAPWINTAMRRLSRKKHRLFKKARKSHGKHRDVMWARYKSCKASFNTGIKQARDYYLNNIISSAFDDNNTKPFWKFVRSKRCDNTGIAPLKDSGRLHTDSQSKANILNNQFTSVFNIEDTSDIPVPSGPSYPSMPEFEINVCGVQKLLHTIKPNKASGPDSIPCRVLKEAASELAPALADIFNSSLSVGTLPDDWKTAHVAPAFKKGNTNAAENYRPISLTCVCCKLLEHIICHHIRAHLDNHNILSIFQHGFRSGHSCDSQLLSTVHDLMSIFDRKKQVDVAVLDFSKAFDVVPHQRLLGKLRHCGVNGRALEWIADFLSGRTQRVVVDGAYSRWSPVHSGVPQGTVLGPLLFLIYINDLPDSVSSTVRLFADDCLVYREVGSIDDQLALQRDLDSLENWAHIWGMKFNPSKCTILTISRSPPLHKFYSLCGTILQQVSEAKYLGVNISEDLHWSKHIQG